MQDAYLQLCHFNEKQPIERGQPEAPMHRCSNSQLNTLNLAPGNGRICSEEISTVAGVAKLREADGQLEGRIKILQLDTDFCSCPEEVLHIFCLLLEAALACF